MFRKPNQQYLVLIIALVAMTGTNIILDFYESQLQNSAFYFTESFLFSCFWILFAPMFLMLSLFHQKSETFIQRTGVVLVVLSLHLLIYPALVWLLSVLFFENTFFYWQTLGYGITFYLIKAALIYGFALFVFSDRLDGSVQNAENKDTEDRSVGNTPIQFIVVTDHNHLKLVLATLDIYCISAQSPYVKILHKHQHYLHTDTLKSLEKKLDERLFVRIHKSHIVNISKIISFHSRQNGDYDIKLSNDFIIRASRNYASSFKAKMSVLPQLALK
ncbi:MAG TPA: LytTR family DNA-binding domain-containing protein [Niabella sp.]|nr:LytTR family DNA-binding domain-containing protein [Niabella sp.]HOZ97928.1 LytTR family DNA-binding domain-containing protein [Niabella sp.]HQW15926.1 LytTR family DNA-binding domain-containing protein [Niabella sp.]HQX21126.1 LytTR family DNA-binding domain-containing protein [Niabella sp.]HQX40574.1 LytTR family DNA-binding domain-containing protein [Niabella sp.]